MEPQNQPRNAVEIARYEALSTGGFVRMKAERDDALGRARGAQQRIEHLERQLRGKSLELQQLREKLLDQGPLRVMEEQKPKEESQHPYLAELAGILKLRDATPAMVITAVQILMDRIPPKQSQRLRHNVVDRLRRRNKAGEADMKPLLDKQVPA